MPKHSAHKPSSLAVNTDRAFVACLREHRALSRAAIATKTGISKPTVSESAQRLLSRELISECAVKDTQTSKRPAVLYEVNKDRGISIAIVLEENRSQLCATDLQGNVRQLESKEFSRGRTVEQFEYDLVDFIRYTVEQISLPLLSIGVSIADPVHPKTGRVVPMPHSPFPTAQQINFVELLTTEFQCSLTIDNDVNWATLHEQQTTGFNNFLYVFLGRGIGCGLYFDQTLIRGHNGMAGEIGYLTLNNEKNLLESVYTEAFFESAKNQPEHVHQNDVVNIIKALRSVCEVTAPQSIILGGELTQNERFSETLITQAKSLLPNTTIKTSHSPEAASLHGTAHAAHELALISLGLLDEQSASSYLGFYSMSFIEESA
ncbi:ROK family transcriptional regulator [Marinomonas communis]|uniref:ROK family transcriptional regulator n=1 Tax=Marinomonas communis TaxID=28254 RepID=UPI001D183513|nr:ROK family transcriptional regulator [Marinomonas communis]MCC4273837.1 ROK family transcriptional regulator [Marinomonas communis]